MTDDEWLADALTCAGIQAATDIEEQLIGDLTNWQPIGILNAINAQPPTDDLRVEYTVAVDRAGQGNLDELKREIGHNLDPALQDDLLQSASEMVDQRVSELNEDNQP